VLLTVGLVLMGLQLLAPMERPLFVLGFRMDFHWAILGSMLALVGYQVILVDTFAKMYAMTRGIREEDPFFRRAVRALTLERVLVIGFVTVALGCALDGIVAWRWLRTDLGALVSGYTRVFIFGSTLVALGVQTIFSAFFLSILRDDWSHRDD
jgi:hypothetical protein